MDAVSEAIHRYATQTGRTTSQCSQPVNEDNNETRDAYLRAHRTTPLMQAFLSEQALRLSSAFDTYNGTLTCIPVRARVECLDDKNNVLCTCTTHIDANARLTSVGRLGDVRTPAFANHVSRYHVLVAHVAFTERGVPDTPNHFWVFIDFWSHGGTELVPEDGAPTHTSFPNTRRVLMARTDTPVTLRLGNLRVGEPNDTFAPPLRVRFTLDNATLPKSQQRTCVICMDAPRTEVFTSCGHLVACAACCATLVKRGDGCPLCKQPIQGVRSARVDDTATFCD